MPLLRTFLTISDEYGSASPFPVSAQIIIKPVEFSSDTYRFSALKKDNNLISFKVIYASENCILLEINRATMDVHKGKSVPLQAWSGPEGSRKLRFSDFMTTAQDGGKVVSLTHRPPLSPMKCSWHSFLLEAESTSGPWCDRKDFMSAGIEPATFRFVAQHFDHCATAVPVYGCRTEYITSRIYYNNCR